MRRMCGARRKVHEERFIGRERLLLADPFDGTVGQILGQCVVIKSNHVSKYIESKRTRASRYYQEEVEIGFGGLRFTRESDAVMRGEDQNTASRP